MHSFATILLALSLPLHALAAHEVNLRRHAEMALRPRQNINGARITYYDITVGTTACGSTYPASAFVVALDGAMFGNTPGNSPYCYKPITLTCNGQSVGAIIADKCPGCPPGGLDLTSGLFKQFAPLTTGVLTCDWSVGGEAPQASTTSSTPPPPPATHSDPPSTTYSPPPPSTTSSSTSTSSTSKTSSSVSSTAPTTTQQSSSTSSTTQTSGANYNNSPASSLAQPTGSVSSGQNESIIDIYQAIIALGSLVNDDS